MFFAGLGSVRIVHGLALVASGLVPEGMRSLDEVNAAVIAGELTDLVCIRACHCYMIAACERVCDCERALQWCARLKVFSAKWGLRPLFSVCRTQYASICLWPGACRRPNWNYARPAMSSLFAAQPWLGTNWRTWPSYAAARVALPKLPRFLKKFNRTGWACWDAPSWLWMRR